MKNHSRQREAILKVLRETKTHPTASWIYNKVREEIPNISLGTVYRNLKELNRSGEIISVNVGDGFEHFDGDDSPHLHLKCRCCNSLVDAPLSADLKAAAEKDGFTPENSVFVIYGLCKNCKENSKINN